MVNGSEIKVQSLSRRMQQVGDAVDLFLPTERCMVVPRAAIDQTPETQLLETDRSIDAAKAAISNP